MKSKEELKKLFENGDRPTQKEFWEWQDSYWHKEEKLPTDNTGLYKIKGSVANLDALTALTNMLEGDVYNLLDTGDNYVYVLDLNNTNIAGWDKFSGIVDLSSINLQTVLDNGNIVIDQPTQSSIYLDLNNRVVSHDFYDSQGNLSSFVHNQNVISSLVNNQSFGTSIISDAVNGYVQLNIADSQTGDIVDVKLTPNSALTYDADYSSRFKNRSIPDVAYVTSKTTLQSVLDNNNTAHDGFTHYKLNTGKLDDNIQPELVFHQENLEGTGQISFMQSIAAGGYATLLMRAINNSAEIGGFKSFTVTLDHYGLRYNADYSSDSNFGPRNLVDKAYVDNAITNVGGDSATLQSVLNNGGYAIDEATQSFINIDLPNGGFQTYFQDSNQSILASISSNLMMTNIIHRDGLGESFINVVTGSEGMLFSNTSPTSNLTAQVALIGNQGLVYAEDYSSRFTDRSLVDKTYVDASFTRTEDIEIIDSTKGIILTSPIGNRFRITVADDGILTTTAFD